MASVSEYPQQLEAVNQLLEQTPEGPQRCELLSLKQNIEELLLLTVEPSSDAKSESNSSESDRLDDEYMRFMVVEMGKEGAIESSSALEQNSRVKQFKDLEGKKFRAPHKHPWGQLVYHNAMVCSVSDDTNDTNDLQVKVLFLNPTHKEMLPCPYFFDLEKDCHFSEERCKFSHGELVSYSSLQDYIEPKFEDLAVGSEVLAKQCDNLWYRGKVAEIMKEKCLIKFDSRKDRSENYEEIIFEDIFPLEQTENGSDDDDWSSSEFQVVDEWNRSEEDECSKALKQSRLINMSLMTTPDTVPLGDWEKYTKGIGSKLMQKMGYIVGTGLGKEGSGIIKPVTAQILPQGKSLDFCMNLKERAKNPHLFNADNKSKRKNKAAKKMEKETSKKEKRRQKIENMNLDQYVTWYFVRSKTISSKDDDDQIMLRNKLKSSTDKEINVANFKLEAEIEKLTQSVERLKMSIGRLEGLGQNPRGLRRKLPQHEISLKRLTLFGQVIRSELDRRKTSKEMTVF